MKKTAHATPNLKSVWTLEPFHFPCSSRFLLSGDPSETESRVPRAPRANTDRATVPAAVDVLPLFTMGKVLLGVRVLSSNRRDLDSGLIEARAERMGAKSSCFWRRKHYSFFSNTEIVPAGKGSPTDTNFSHFQAPAALVNIHLTKIWILS